MGGRSVMGRTQNRKHTEPRSAPAAPHLEPEIAARILLELSELKNKVDESLEQVRECNTDLKLLRKELGVDGSHGRLPVVEAAVARHESRIGNLEAEKIEVHARHKLIHSILAFCGGGLGGSLITICGRVFGGH